MTASAPCIGQIERLYLHDRLSPTRPRVEAFIGERFAAVHAARVCDFLPTLISSESATRRLQAAAGFQMAEGAPLFLEAYLDAPVEAYLSALSRAPVSRRQIIEFGNLATVRPGAIRGLILSLASYFRRRGMAWAVLTLTPTLINSFTRLGFVMNPLAPARAERLSASASHWGRYYDLNPQVVAIDVALNTPRLLELERLETARAGRASPLLPLENTHDIALLR